MKKTQLADFDNGWYRPGNKLKITLWYFVNVLFFKNGWMPVSSVKVTLLRTFGAKIGNSCVIKPCVNIKYPWLLNVGNDVWIGEEVWIDNLAEVTIEDNVCISQGALLLCGNHNYKKTSFDLIVRSITLQEGCWIGAKATVCPGVRVGSHAVLTVGSVATTNLDSYSIYQGNPAAKTKTRIIN